MYSYSPIKKIYIKNFRNIGEATIDFTESPIVSLIGENEQGKTQVVKAIAVCAMHATPRDQKDYIRDGTKGFGIAMELEDGTQVVRMKMATANSYRVSYPKDENGEPIRPTWEASKIDSGLPKAVQEVIGMIEEPETKEFLHIRTYEDQLLFVTTASSTNYKVMYNALQISQLVDAIKLGQKEANGYKTQISQTQISAETLENRANGLKIFDLEPLQNIRDRIAKEKQQIEKIEKAINVRKKLKSQIEELGELAKLQGLKEINDSLAVTLGNTGKTIQKIKELDRYLSILKPIDGIQCIDLQVEQKIEAALDRIGQINKCKETSQKITSVESLSEIDLNSATKIQRALNLKHAIRAEEASLERIDTKNSSTIADEEVQGVLKCQRALSILNRNIKASEALKQADEYCEQIKNWFKAIGVNTETCPKCGETIVIDLDKQ